MPNPFQKQKRFEEIMSQPVGSRLTQEDRLIIDEEMRRRQDNAKAMYDQYRQEMAARMENARRPAGAEGFKPLDYAGELAKRLLFGVTEGLASTAAMGEDVLRKTGEGMLKNRLGGYYNEQYSDAMKKAVEDYGLFHNLYYGNGKLNKALNLGPGIREGSQMSAERVREMAESINTGNNKADKALRWLAEKTGDVSYGVGNAVPMAAEAMLTGGASLAAGVASSADDLARMGVGVMEKSGALAALQRAGSKLLQDRQYWTSFASEVGSDYMEALNDGATEEQAMAYAVAASGLNSIIEIGGGIQDPTTPLWKSAIEEGVEEMEQGPAGRALKYAFYKQGSGNLGEDLFTGEDAVFNPRTMLEEGAMGAAVGGVLSGGQHLAGKAIASGQERMAQNAAYKSAYGADSGALVQEALDIDPDNKVAQAAQKRLEQGKKLSGDTMRRLVEMNDAAIETQEQQRSTEEQTAEAQSPAEPVKTAPSYLTADETSELEQKFGKAGAEAFASVKPANVSDSSYYHAFNTAFQYGSAGVDIQRTMEAVGGKVPGEVTLAAYAAGKGQADYRTQQAQLKIDRSQISATPNGKVGAVRFDGVSEAGLTGTQRSSVQVLRGISNVTGINFRVFASRTDQAGRFVDENGAYDAKTNTISIDINAGRISTADLNDVVMGKTASHELTHFIQKNNPTAYKALKQFVAQQLADKGMRLDDLIQKKIDRARGELTEDEAMDEVVADACEDMLKNTTSIDRLAKENWSLFKHIRNWLHNFHNALKRAFSGEGYRHAEAKAMLDRAAELQKLWDDAFVKAVENYRQSGGEQLTGEDVEVKQSIREATATAGIEMVQDKDTGKLSFMLDGRPVTHVTAQHIADNSAFGALIRTARDGIGDIKGHISEAEADKQFQAVADIMNLVMTTQNPEMVWEVAGSQLFSAIKSNSDGQYGTTVDFSTVCRKTADMIKAMSEAMIAKGAGLTKAEVTELQHDLIQRGLQVPCPVCYVFSRWAGVGSILDNMRKFQDKYTGMSDEEVRARIAELKGRDTKAERNRIRADLLANDEAYITLAATRERYNEEKKRFRKELKAAQKAGDTVLIESLTKSIENADFMIKNAAKQMDEMVKSLDTGAQELSWLERVRTKEGYRPVPADVLFNLADGSAIETFMKDYPASWAYRTTRGPSAGKAILPYSDMKLGDLTMPLKSKASDGNKTFANPLDIKGEFNDAQKKAIVNAIARVRAQNLIGGQRFQSTSDFRYDYALDYIQVFFEAQALGSNMQTYTKIIEFGEMVAKIGGDVNLSVMPRNKGYENGHLIFSNVTGINFDAARRLNAMYDSAQLILVGINDEHIRLALEDSEETGGIHIGFVIPYHTSGASIEEFIRALVSNLNEDFVRSNYQDYSDVQTDHEKKTTTAEQRQRRDLRRRLLTGGEISDEDMALMKRDAAQKTDITGYSFEELLEIENAALAGDADAIREYESWSSGALWDLYRKMWTEGGSEYGVRLNSKQAEAVMPHEYWNKQTTRGNAYVNGFIFRSYCYNMGLSPRFTGISSRGAVDHGDFRESRGYWKTLIDRAMYANDGTYRDQKKINLSELQAGMITPEYAEENWGEFKVAEPQQDVAAQVGREFGLKKNTFADPSTGERVQKSERDIRTAFVDGRITVSSTEEERYAVLKDATITPATVDMDKLDGVSLDVFNTRSKSSVEKGMRSLAAKLGVTGVDISASQLDFPFRFSNTNLFKSLHHQLEYGGTYQDYAKALTCFADIVEGAVPIETHTEKKTGTSKANPDLEQVYVLVSAFLDGDDVVPVQLEVKKYKRAVAGLYLNVMLTKIDSGVLERPSPTEIGTRISPLFPKPNYTLRSLLANVNTQDGRFLKYAPDGFLDEERLDAKEKALRSQKDEYAHYDAQYSLRDVDPVHPGNGGWQRTIDTQEALRRFPGLWNVTAEESEVRNPTQIKSTVSTYRKIYDLLKAEGFDGTILDASSGLGYGTRAGREEYGLDVDDIEPYPDASYKPRYTDYSRLNKTYDAIISNAVLNVLPQDQRDALVVKMGEMLNPGGKMYINVRGKDVDTLASGKDNVRISPMEWYVASTGSYQKGFTKAELKAYLEDALGPGYTVETTSKFGGVAVIVTKDTERVQRSERDVEAISDRELLANALETVAQNEVERDILKRYQAKTAALEEIQQKLAEQRALMAGHISGRAKLSTEEMLKARNRAELYARQLDRADRELLKLESMASVKAMLDREHKAYRKALKAADRAEALRQRYNEKLMKQVEENRQRLTNYRQARRETEARRKYKARINRIASDFRQMLLHPTDSRYSPTELLSSAYEIALMLDTSGEREDTKAKAKFREQMRRLEDQYDALQNSKDSDYQTEYDPEFAFLVKQLRQRLDGRAVRDLTVTELEDVANVLNDLNEMLKQAKYQIGKAEKVTNYSVGESIIRQQRQYAAESRSWAAQRAASVERLSANAMRNVRRMTGYDDDAALARLVQDLNEGIRKKNRFTMESNKLFDKLSGKRMRQAATEEKTYSIGGEEVKMTEMQAMQLVLSWEREASNGITKHLTSGGILIPDAALMKKGQGNEAVRVGTMANGITQEDITAIYESMDEWARDYMDAARYFFNVLAQNAINEATMQTKHRRIATTRNYIPFEIDPYTVAQEIEGVKFDATIEGMGMLKSVQEGAANALVIRGLDTIIQRHIERAGQVYGLAVPIRNYNKAMGIHLIGDNRTARESLHSEDLKLLDNAVRDLQTPRTRDRNAVTQIMDKLQSAFVKSTLLSNVSVTIKQAASYSTAGLYLSQKALAPYQGTIAKLFANNDSKFARDLFAEIDEHTAAHYIRRQGMSLQEAAMIAQDQSKLVRLMDEKIKNDALNPLKWIQNMDVATTGALWLACKKQVELDGTKQSDDGYWAKVSELYDKVIEDTQPMYDVLHRPEIQRTTDSFVKAILMFKTQPLQNAGIIWDAVGQYAAAQKSGKNLAEAKQLLGRAVGSQVASLAVFAGMSFLAYAVKNRLGRYKDDEEELTAESVIKRILLDMASNSAGLVMPLFGSEAYTAIDGIVTRITTGKQAYDALSAPMLDMVNGWIKDVGTVFTHLSDLDSHSGDIPSDLMTVGYDLSALFGIPAENVYNIFRGVVGNVGDWTGHPVEWATDNPTEKELSSAMKVAYNNGHYDTAKKKMEDLFQMKVEAKVKAGEKKADAEKEAKTALKSTMTSYFKPLYKKAYRSGDKAAMERIRTILVECGLYDDVIKTLATWTKDD